MSFTIDAATTRYTLEKHIEAEAQLYKGLDGRVYAKFQWVDGTEIVSVDSRRFEDWLVRHCIDSGHPVIKSAIKLAISSIKARYGFRFWCIGQPTVSLFRQPLPKRPA